MREYKTIHWVIVLAAVLTAPAALAQFSISGTVRNNAAAQVAGVGVRLFDDNDNPIGIPPLQTDAAGFYSINGLPSGQYVLQFDPPVATRLLATQKPATINSVDTILNVSLLPGNLLAGFVRDIDGVGIAAIDLQVVDRDSGDPVLTPGDDTNATGFYDVVIPDGEFDLEWRAVAAGSLPWLPVTRREDIVSDTTIDITMVIGFFVSGTVRDSNGLPVLNVNMDFIDEATGIKLDTPGDNTNASGLYEVQIPAGVYTVRAKPRVEDRLAAGELFNVTVLSNTTGIDMTLAPGVAVSGRVTRSGGIGVGVVDIDAADAITGDDYFLAFDSTDADGFYLVVIPPGLVELTFEPSVATMLAPVRTAPMDILQDTVYNVTLPDGVSLSGTVRDHQQVAVAGADIDALDAATGLSVPLVGDSTDEAGSFVVIVVPGTYHIEIEPPKVLGLVAERRLNQILMSDTVISVTLQPGARVTGTVTDPAGLAVAGVDIDVLTIPGGQEVFTPADRTDVLGRYEIIIPPATYRFLYQPGLESAHLDTLELNDVVVIGDRVIDVQLPGGEVAVGDDLPDRMLVGIVRNFPNPFNPSTVISFELSRPAHVQLGVYTVAGELVTVLGGARLAAGRHSVRWQGRDVDGRAVPSGVYVYRLVADGTVASGKMLLTK